jgi:hypothetical protein
MKKILMAMLVLSSFTSHANACLNVNDGEILGLDAVESAKIVMPKHHVKIWNQYFDYELSAKCRKIMTSHINFLANGEVYYSYTTNEDECDGGNVFGLYLNAKNEVIVEISDSYPMCPKL